MLNLGRRADLGRRWGGNVPSIADLMTAQLSHMRNVSQIYYCDATNGNDAASGQSWKNAFKTIQKAVDVAPENSTIFLMGTFTEDVNVDTAGLTLIGCGNGIRAARWNALAAGSNCVSVDAAYVTFDNIYFAPKAYSSGGGNCIVIDDDAQYLTVRNCRFQGATGAYKAIYAAAVGPDNVHIIGNEFRYFNTATHGGAIRGDNAGGFQFSGWVIRDNVFNSCVTAVKASCKCALVLGNYFAEAGVTAAGATNATVCTTKLDLSGDDATNSGANQVHGNYFGGDYSNTGGYKAGATGDDWCGNYCMDVDETEVADNGITIAVPAA